MSGSFARARRTFAVVLAFGSASLPAGLLAGCAVPMDEGDAPLSEDEIGALMEQAFAEQQDDDKEDTASCSGVRVPDRGPFGKRVALTFDDGPSTTSSPTVLEVLRRHRIPATFFVNGSRVTSTATRALLREVAGDRLFHVGNHTQDHKNLTSVSSAEVSRQIDRTADVLRAAGVAPRYFRFPYGSSSCATAQAVRNRGYSIVGWHVDSADWCYASGSGYCAPRTFGEVPTALRRDMPGWVLQQVRQSQGGIVLMHDIHGFTARSLEGIVQRLLDEGYTFVGLDDLSAFPQLNGRSTAPPAPPPPPVPPPIASTASRVLYPADRRHSPITSGLVERLRTVAASGPSQADDVFAKVGDSITASESFLRCFDGARVDLGGRGELEPTLVYYGAGDAAGASPYARTSLAATVGWSASAALAGNPTALARELDATHPRLGVLMFGTNDVGFRDVEAFARDMLVIVDTMLARGTIPLLSSIPPRDDSASADASVGLFNLAVRAIAQGRGVPFVDYHRELLPLASHGLAGDHVHPATYSGGACVLDASGLRFGANLRNLLTLEQLDRARRALDGEALDVDAEAPQLQGDGSAQAPFEITTLPFAVLADTRTSSSRALSGYACSSSNESGPELRYRLVLDRAARVTAATLSTTGVDIDVHLLDASGTAGGCLARSDRTLTRDLPPGTYYVVADTYVSRGTERAGEALLLVDAE